MRLYRGQVSLVAKELVDALVEEGDLEVEDQNINEVQLDVESVLKEFIRLDRELSNQAKDIQAAEGGSFGRHKSRLAKKKGVDLVDDPIGYIIDQCIDIFFHSNFVNEVFSGDRTLRLRMKPILEKHMSKEEQLDEEVRDRIKNLEEGTKDWDVEYEKVMNKLKQNQNLE